MSGPTLMKELRGEASGLYPTDTQEVELLVQRSRRHSEVGYRDQLPLKDKEEVRCQVQPPQRNTEVECLDQLLQTLKEVVGCLV